MAIFYRGAGPGTYWNIKNARHSGFIPQNPGLPHSTDRIIQHVYNGLIDSPYVSLTLSYGVALSYALETGTSRPTARDPGVVYEVEINDGDGVELIDPVKEIANGAPNPLSPVNYQHNGDPTVLLGIVSPVMGAFLRTAIPTPPGATTTPALHVSSHLSGLVAALRDAEILARGHIPANCVAKRWNVY